MRLVRQAAGHYRLTLLVALYRAGAYLPAKLRTLERQTRFADCQVVLLNCQNLDRESELYGSFVQRHANVSVVEYDDHIKLYSSWNDGIRLSRSDYVANSNADDQLHPEYAAAHIAALDDHPDCGVAMAKTYVTAVPNQDWPWTVWHGDITVAYPGGTAGPCPVWRRELHDRFGYFADYRVIGDADMWERWHAGGVRFHAIDRYLSLYYQGANLECRLDEATGQRLFDLDIDERLRKLGLR